MESANRENSNEMKLVFDSRPANEGLARVAVAAFCTQLNPTLEEVADLKTAVSEAVTNCILHAYDGKVQPEETEGKSGGKMMGEKYQIELRCRLKGQELSVDVIDHGVGIGDIKKAMEPLYTTGGEERAGLGFAVMQSFCDSVRVTSTPGRGTSVTLTKYFDTKQ